MNSEISQAIDQIYREQSRHVFATLVRLLGDFDAAEEALHEAFAIALEQWQSDGMPENPRAWLVSTGRFKAIDAMRRRGRQTRVVTEMANQALSQAEQVSEAHDVVDDRLRLIFTCCHPDISMEAQIALTLREVCDLTTDQIASAFFTSTTTMAQRIVRAKTKIRQANIAYEVPAREQLPARLDAVLHVIYLVFHEGYAPASGSELTRPDLSQEAIRLGRLLLELLPEPEVMGLVALMLLHESRRVSRTNARGELVLLEDQDRTQWDRKLIAEGRSLIERSFRSRRIGPYALQAAIAAVHAEAPAASQTDWAQIVQLYDHLLRIEGSPVVELNRAVAIAMRDGPMAGLSLIDELIARGDLADYHLAHAARADLCRRLGDHAGAYQAYSTALKLVKLEPERKFLEARLKEVQPADATKAKKSN